MSDGILSGWGFCLMEFCQGGVLYDGVCQGGFCLMGFCQSGFCLMEFCQGRVLSDEGLPGSGFV